MGYVVHRYFIIFSKKVLVFNSPYMSKLKDKDSEIFKIQVDEIIPPWVADRVPIYWWVPMYWWIPMYWRVPIYWLVPMS